MLGQASGGFLESSSALRLLHVGIRNTTGVLTNDAFTQTNPPVQTTLSTISLNVDTATLGVLSGSVAFTRPDQGSNFIGGAAGPTLLTAGGAGIAATSTATSLPDAYQPLGLFINNAVGNAYENTPGPASGRGPYVSAMGTYASALFETQCLAAIGALAQGAALPYITGVPLVASLNGYLMPASVWDGVAHQDADINGITFQATAKDAEAILPAGSTIIAILKMPADSAQPEIMFDQRI
jgi:hypothetical protein